VVENTDVDTLFNDPKHPYTQALLSSVPKITAQREPLAPIQGMVPNPFRRPTGCGFNTRCGFVKDVCRTTEPSLIQIGSDIASHKVRCLLYEQGLTEDVTVTGSRKP
jgi:oligopeptide/dipeptide ABC transporter ATP-binding protein